MTPPSEGAAAGPQVDDLRRLAGTPPGTAPAVDAMRLTGPVPALFIGAALVSILAIDLALPRGYDISSLYAIVVLASGFTRVRRTVIATSLVAAAMALAVMAGHVSTAEGDLGPVLFSHLTAVALIALSAGAVLAALARTAHARRLEAELLSAERSQALTDRMLDTAARIAPIGTWYFDPQAQTVTWRKRAAAIIGVEPFTPIDVGTAITFLAPHERERFLGIIIEAWNTGVPFREEFESVTPQGDTKHLVILGDAAETDGSGRTLMHGTVQDITRWVTNETKAEVEARKFAGMSSSVPFAIWSATPEGVFDYANDAMLDYAGMSTVEELNSDWRELIHPEDRSSVASAWDEALLSGTAYRDEYRVRAGDGTYAYFSITAAPDIDPEGRITRWWGSSLNVDSTHELRKRAEQLANEVATILESTTDGVYAVDHDWRVVYANSSAKAEVGRLSEDVVGKLLWEMFPFEPDSAAREGLQAAMAASTPSSFTYYSNGLKKWFAVTATPTPTGLSVFHRDITEMRRMSEQLAHTQKLESVGRLTGGIAHDFNNVLTVVLGGAEAIAEDPAVGHEAREMAELVVESARRGADLTSRLLAFARKQPLAPRAVDIESTLDSLAPMLRRSLGEHIELTMAQHQDLPAVMIDAGQFENALLNLAINARDSMPDGGRLTIGASETVLDEEYARIHSEVRPGRYVLVDVSDTGSGIDKESLDHLFEPFYTTKEKGKGSGLGLAMVWGFVKQTGGHISVYSEEGVGTTFKLYLPLSPSDVEVTAPPELRPVRPILPGTILLAEDDDLVRAFAAERLRGLGHTVYAAESGPAALALLDTIDQVDLLFTDVIMPGGMTGRDLADEVARRRPDVPVLFTSGYTENVVLHNGRLDQGVLLLTKPYSADQLLERVYEALERGKAKR